MYRIDVLLKQKNHIFHTRDLALLWGVTNNNTLYTIIKRYVDRGILIPIHKGLYATIHLDQLDPLVLGAAAIHAYCYVSCEYVLVRAGIIFQAQNALTFISNTSRSFALSSHTFLVRQLRDRFLFCDIGLRFDNNIWIATVERAMADMLYYNPQYHIDNSRGLDWNAVQKIRKEIGYL